ncbi:hypothetical protein [Halovivax gelatinilyticus]|uniref:hypothetical protein n=1 Tax=Halovivax gelatinilyticus TaxID=2961597 RepID=UPI0020CA9807|nr:hypothetical protein [Halovivax gelatinilyticus]
MRVVRTGCAQPVVVPAAFVAGVTSWKLVTPTTRLGAVARLVGTLAAFGILCLYAGVGVVLNVPSGDPAAAVGFALTMTLYGFVFTFWATIPIGCLSGAVYQTLVGRESMTE